MREKTNCPNCGAPISGIKCEYCGTQFFDLADIELNKYAFLRVRIDNNVLLFEAIPTEMEIDRGCYRDQAPEIAIRFVVNRACDSRYFVEEELRGEKKYE